MPRKIIFGDELRDSCNKTMNIIHKAVVSSLGPSGKLSLLDRGKQSSLITKDGVSIARNCLPLPDEVMNLLGGKILEIANKTNSESGDGTTTSIVLAKSIYNEAIKVINEGIDPVVVKNEIERVLPRILKTLDERAIKISTFDETVHVATISANNEIEIGKIIAEAIDKVGQDGFVTLSEGEGEKPSLTITEGMQIKKGPATERYLKGRITMDFDNPSILIVDGKIDLMETLNDLYTQVAGRPFVVIGELSEIAQEYLIENCRKGQISCVHIPPTMFGGLRVKLLTDIAVAVGAKVIDPINYDFAQSIDKSVLGSCNRLTFNRYQTSIIEGSGSREEILKRVKELKVEMESTKSQYEKDVVRERIASLTCGAAVIGVGGATEDEIYERKDRFEDALNATRSALMDGIIPGGGFALFTIAQELKNEGKNWFNMKQKIGERIFSNALEAPLIQIIKNTGADVKKITNSIKKTKLGYDAKKHILTDLIRDGILDPVRSTKSGLKNAVSIVDLLINLECLSVNVLDKDNVKEVMDVMRGVNADDV